MTQQLSKWFVRTAAKRCATRRLICFPFAGGTSRSYASWADQLPDDVELLSIELPGRGARFNEPFALSISALARELARDFDTLRDRPYSVYGHSLGALLAFEFAHDLARTEGRQPDALIVSGKRAPQETRNEMIHALPEGEFLAHIRTYNVTAEEILADAQLLELLVPRLRADFALSETYRQTPGPKLTCKLVCCGGLDDPETQMPLLEAWEEQAGAEFLLRRFPGEHFFIFDEENDFVAAMSGFLL